MHLEEYLGSAKGIVLTEVEAAGGFEGVRKAGKDGKDRVFKCE